MRMELNRNSKEEIRNPYLTVKTFLILKKTMSEIERITQCITDFVKGGDNSDVELLDSVLHEDFRVTNNGFIGTSGVIIFDKEEYLEHVRNGEFGGIPREMEILEIDQTEIIVMVKLSIESFENDFISYNSLILDNEDNWKIINNLAIVKAKMLV